MERVHDSCRRRHLVQHRADGLGISHDPQRVVVVPLVLQVDPIVDGILGGVRRQSLQSLGPEYLEG